MGLGALSVHQPSSPQKKSTLRESDTSVCRRIFFNLVSDILNDVRLSDKIRVEEKEA